MFLRVDDYVFPIVRVEYDWTPYIEYYFGNPSCKPKPCIHITIEQNDPLAIINTIDFYKSCSISEKAFNRGTGAMVLFVKTVLKWLIKEYPDIQTFSLTDESYYKTNGGAYLLPEKMLLTEGKTWYQKHFGAIPSSRTEKLYNSYLLEYQKHEEVFKQLPNTAWLESNLAKTIQPYQTLYLKSISGTEWFIHRNTIESYDIPPFEFIKTLQKGGNIPPKTQKISIKPRKHRIPRPWSLLLEK
jgi:hypothetical protein